MATRRKLSTLLGLFAVVTASLFLVAPSPAYADRCQPEELTPIGAGGSPVDERDNPACVVVDTYLYPYVCPGGQPKPLGACLQTLNPDTSYRPPLVPTYNPDAGRIYCGLYNFAVPGGTCTN